MPDSVSGRRQLSGVRCFTSLLQTRPLGHVTAYTMRGTCCGWCSTVWALWWILREVRKNITRHSVLYFRFVKVLNAVCSLRADIKAERAYRTDTHVCATFAWLEIQTGFVLASSVRLRWPVRRLAGRSGRGRWSKASTRDSGDSGHSHRR